MPAIKRAVKDSVFTCLFRIPQYALQLYQALHPEDKEVTEADCKIVTLENILTVGIYNDFGLLVKDSLLLFVEAQSTFSLNIVFRVLLYLAEAYRRYADENELDLYGTKTVKIPRPEVYVIYTGTRKDVPDELYLSDLYYDGKGCLELEVKVFRTSGTRNIAEQYVRFCQIIDEKRKEYGMTSKVIEETLRQCREEGILVPFLNEHETEVQDIMGTLFSQERIWEIHDYNVAKEAREEGIAQGIERGIEQGIERGIEQGIEQGIGQGTEMTLLSNLKALMKKFQLTAEEAMDTLEVSPETRAKLLGQL